MTEPGLILAVDDDPDARAMLTSALTEAGFATLVAVDGAAALEVARRARPNLIVLDAVMPGLSGFETCRQLKVSPELADIPVVFMTGLAETEHVVEGFRSGGVDYVVKPVVLEELVARIHVHLANARMAVSARSALDVAGRSLICANADGRVLWRTPQAGRLLSSIGVPDEALNELSDAMRNLSHSVPDLGALPLSVRLGETRLNLSYLGGAGDEHFFRLAEPIDGREEGILRDALKLTAREADVLVWIGRGKSNRDISEILNISARTVNKHLEQIFTKLGVENRAAAAAVATRIVAASN